MKFLVSFKSWLRVRLEELSEAQHLNVDAFKMALGALAL